MQEVTGQGMSPGMAAIIPLFKEEIMREETVSEVRMCLGPMESSTM